MKDIFEKIKTEVAGELSEVGHDFDHVMRVYNMCLKLSENEKVDLEVIKASALLHDIARVKERQGKTGEIDHAVLGAEMAREILGKFNFPKDKIEHVKECIISHRYKNDHQPKSLEAKILNDADKIDSAGATGVARAYFWIGEHNGRIYFKPDNMKEYIRENLGGKINGKVKDKTKHSPQIEYQNKYKRIGELLYTKKAKEIYKERLAFYEKFMDRLEREVAGEF